MRKGAGEDGRDFAVFDDDFAAVPRALGLEGIVEQHDVGAAGGREAADLAVHAVAGGGMQRAHAPRGGGFEAGNDGLARDPVEAEEEKIIGVAVVGADADALGVGAEFGDGLDGVRE